MDFSQQLKKVLKDHQLDDALVEALYIDIMRLHEFAKSPVGRKLGVVTMTQSASLAADEALKNKKINPDAKPRIL